jgi:GNAT superfamily N-acetyltransferase
MATTDARLTEHPLLRQHIEGGMALSKAANWNQNEADWQLFFDLGIGMGCSDQNGRLCATTMIIPLGARFAWISVVLVADDMRRRGLASQLTKWAVGELNRMGVVPYLDATPAGREVYLRLGFQDCWWLERLIAPTLRITSAALSTIIVRPIDDAVWPKVLEYDAAIGARSSPRCAIGRRTRRGTLWKPGASSVSYSRVMVASTPKLVRFARIARTSRLHY